LLVTPFTCNIGEPGGVGYPANEKEKVAACLPDSDALLDKNEERFEEEEKSKAISPLRSLKMTSRVNWKAKVPMNANRSSRR